MKKIFHILYSFLKRVTTPSLSGRVWGGSFLILLSACTPHPENVKHSDALPEIYPDYIGVTIPANIAPMNFNAADEAVERMEVTARGSKGGEIHTNGEWVAFDHDEWKELTQQNVGGEIRFTVCMLKDGQWTEYQTFAMYVSTYPLEDYGITYRRIPPGYEVGGNIGIYQRDLHSFKETAILQESAVPGQCMNCHTANRTDPKQFYLHLRGSHGGTVIQQNGQRRWLETKTSETIGATAHGCWHPDGRFIAFSLSPVAQAFYVGTERLIEPFDLNSDMLMLDVETDELIRTPLLETEDYETFPNFSADGKKLFFSSAKYYQVPASVDSIRYSLCTIEFDTKTGCWGTKVDTLLNAQTEGKSFTFPRASYDGKWLMYCQTDFGMFPVDHPEGDLWLMDLQTGERRALEEVNSNDAESYHSWSSNSHWFVFTSRRGDGMYTQLYLSCIDENGKVGKSFLLPQKNPRKYYMEMFDAYNCPDFTKTKVDFNMREVRQEVFSDKRIQVKIKP